MGWPEEQTLHTDISYIISAYEGRIDMLKAIFGSGEEKPKNKDEPKSQKEIGKMFDSFITPKPNQARRARTYKKDVAKKRGNS